MYSGACFVIWKKEFLPNFDRKIKKSFRVYLTQAEGYILGVGAKMFTIAGPVIVYGTTASVIYGLLYWLWGLMG
ncbi:MAG TPA: SpoVA/SpoVAEb family sporulation membrane protein [Candidatus Faecousia excrementipullorum]|nr:SpoVA/SpoVAEb family sporulation membrane protein [Candidatus Faecousia excrementipullorum]